MADRLDIREHMPVLGSDGLRIGTVDHMDGPDRIKLARVDADDDRHHFIPTDWVERIDHEVHLTLSAREARESWLDA